MNFTIKNKMNLILTITVLTIIALLLSSIIGQVFKGYLALIFPFVLLAGLGILLIYKKSLFDQYSSIQNIVFLLIATSFLGAAFFSFNLGFFSIFPFRVLFILLVFLVVLSILFNLRIDFKNTTLAYKPPILFLTIWFLYAILSTLWADNLSAALKSIVFLGFGMGFTFFIIYFLRNHEDYIKVAYIWWFMGAFIVFIGLVNHFLQIHLPISRIYTASAYQKSIPTAVFTNENDFASFLSVTFFLFLTFYTYSKKIIFKGLNILFILLILFLIVVSSSRANLLAIGFGLAVWYLFMLNRKQKLFYLGIFVVGGTLGAVAVRDVVMSVITKVLSELQSLNRISDIGGGGSMEKRVNLILNGFYSVKESLGFGVGAGNAEYFMEHKGIYPTYGDYNVHNWIIEILMNYGVVITILYLALYSAIIYHVYIIWKKEQSSNMKMVAEFLLIALVAFTLAGISPSSILGLNYHWLLFGFSLGFINMHQAKRIKEPLDLKEV
ncbi:O-antigen ligase family protein [Cytobacillus oceanisediminis]|uniref:O-antigen ligase-related domain-containing protein n=1 Tax=Cytobacillus oceanisediminis 2691 TaxID=1196031 RepID=A0A160MHP6_9BACI|nr:O-antigen ligase family protein [Cytobacillus oceanisediminis]AND42238.1 hypothetical protein A361_24845 [Cytobacillus oceanisediminis 2691]